MERTQILKEAGFSDKFLEALQEFEKQVPNIHFESPFRRNESIIESADCSTEIIIDRSNSNYNQNLILTEL